MRAPRARALVVLVLVLGLSGCPARRKVGAAEPGEPGPPEILNPTLLDRG